MQVVWVDDYESPSSWPSQRDLSGVIVVFIECNVQFTLNLVVIKLKMKHIYSGNIGTRSEEDHLEKDSQLHYLNCFWDIDLHEREVMLGNVCSFKIITVEKQVHVIIQTQSLELYLQGHLRYWYSCYWKPCHEQELTWGTVPKIHKNSSYTITTDFVDPNKCPKSWNPFLRRFF